MTTDTTGNLPTVYDPANVEKRIYQFWEQRGYFQGGRDLSKPPFSVVIPPPNVTGMLHVGHALDMTLQDIIVRFKRMNGFDAVWIPGTDHAGIATQARVEKSIRETEGLSRHDLGREEFISRVWDWKKLYGNTITTQIRALGASTDWSRERFTMDEGLSKAVREVFVRLYEKGLIYRGNRIINWCPRCETALSDIEVEHVEEEGFLYHVRYPLSDGTQELVVATSRPETMFADVAIAVHPDDERYQNLIGKTVRLPLTDREIPVIADSYVEMDFGTGCLKITPAHDPNDFEVGMRHNLSKPQCISADGRLNELAQTFAGLTREEGRLQVVEALRNQGFLIKPEPLTHAVGHCSRCDTVVEPFLSDQWFVKMDVLAETALASVRRKELNFVPDRFEKTFVNWVENIRDWCISRQLWWGHRIPAWYCNACNQISVSRDDIHACSHCQSTDIRQDEDVLDTWFSSALWPFSTMGWPDADADDFKRYYPTSALMTGYDILFFWVARMVFMGMEFTGTMPFKDVVLHGLVRATDGRKMSKSLNNGVDPIEVIEKFGSDTVRFTLATSTSPGNDQRFSWEKIEGSRNFINKIWNASRFVLMNVQDGFAPVDFASAQLDVADQWILHRLAATAQTTTEHLNRYDFGEAGRAVYDFAWDDFCDWYIEFSKLSLYGQDVERKQTTQSVLVYVLDQLLRLLHPFIPFVTEEIWQSLPTNGEALILADWPEARAVAAHVSNATEVVRQMAVIMEAIRAVRNLRAELNVAPSKSINMNARVQDAATSTLFISVEHYLKRFCNLDSLSVGVDVVAPDKAVTAVVTGAELYFPLADLVDFAAERTRLEKEALRLEDEVNRVVKKLNNPQFVDKAPAEVVAGERDKAKDYEAKLAAVRDRIQSLL